MLVDDAGRARVADFGLARLVGESIEMPLPAVEHVDSDRPLSQRLKEAGALIGTPRYMSPEQYENHDVDARSDQFSFCAALYEALYRQMPFPGDTILEMGWNVVEGNVRPPPPNDIPKEVTQAILRGLSTDPAQRFPSMQELLAELRKGIDPHIDTASSRRARRIFAWTIAGVGVLGSVPGILKGVVVAAPTAKSRQLI